MEMTRERLEQYRSNLREIKYLTVKLKNLWKDDGLIGNDIIFDYRTGYPKPQPVVGHDCEIEVKRRERYENLRAKLQAENDNIEEFVFGIPDGNVRQIFQLYFLEGHSQDEVARELHMDQATISRKISNFFHLA